MDRATLSRQSPVLLVVVLVFFVGGQNAASGAIRYVNSSAAPGGNGQSWATAYHELVPALTAAQPGDQIWVAAGTYRPDYNPSTGQYTDDPNTSFLLPVVTNILLPPISIYGGFSGLGCESMLSQRDRLKYKTVLSGEIGDPTSVLDNSCHVVRGHDTRSQTILLDGFTITAGYTSQSLCLPHNVSGKINGGAGLLLLSGGATIRNCTIINNSSEFHAGGVLIIDELGVEADDRSTDFVFTEISHNTTFFFGAGLCSFSRSELRLFNCNVIGNDIIYDSGGGPGGGAGMAFFGSGAKLIVNCLVAHNQNNSSVTGLHGGGIEIEDGGEVEIYNSTIVDNGPVHLGGGVDTKGVLTRIHNTIIWGNSANTGRQIRMGGPGNLLDLQYSNIQRFDSNDVVTNSPSPSYVACIGTSTADDPRFLNPTTPPYDYALSNAQPDPSKCIDAGSNIIMALDILDVDLDGVTSEKVPLEIEKLVRRFDDSSVADTGVDDSSENPPRRRNR